MGYDRTAPKQAISVSLNGDLLRQADLLTGDLDGILETLLAEFVAREERRRRDDQDIAEVIEAFNAFHAEHGLISDEFQSF